MNAPSRWRPRTLPRSLVLDDLSGRRFARPIAWAERRARKEIEEEDVYVWWAKVRSANRLEVLPHREYVLAIDEQCKAGRETHLYLTDYRSLYVGQVGEITAEDVVAETPGERDHMPAYYRDLQVDFWFRLFDIRRLAANDTVDVIAQVPHLRNTR